MKKLFLLVLLAMSSCQYLTNPLAIEIEEEIAVDILEAVEHELEK